jgi:hypothetical protein
MRFFSNDSRESADEQADEHPEAVQSQPVAVPQQRPPSPWSAGPGTPVGGGTLTEPEAGPEADDADAELADRERADGTVDGATDGTVDGAADGTPDGDAGAPPFHEPAPQPTAFGAATVGGAVAASALADPQDDRYDRGDAGGGGVTEADIDVPLDDRDGSAAEDRALVDEGTFDDPKVRDGSVETTGPGATAADAAVVDEGTFDDPRVRDGSGDGGASYTEVDTSGRGSDRLRDTSVDSDAGAFAGGSDVSPGGTEASASGSDVDTSAGGSDLDASATGSDVDTSAGGSDLDASAGGTDLDASAGGRDLGSAAGGAEGPETGGHATETDDALRDDGTFEAPQAVDPATEQPLEAADATPGGAGEADGVAAGAVVGAPAGGEAVSDAAVGDAVIAPVPAEAGEETAGGARAGEETAGGRDSAAGTGDKLPGSVRAAEVTTLFVTQDATGFRERWREVQLRFVDDPKQATAEAGALVDEAVDKLTASLREQRGRLSSGTSDDTEHLRVELRGYRDLLNRLLGL